MGNIMKVLLKDSLKIDRPIVFLCGPKFDKNNPHDRRGILREGIIDSSEERVLPLIIDDFLSEKNLKGFKLQLPLLEEILARISRKTFVMLDSMSTAAEMGLFLNHAFENKCVVLLPKVNDIIRNPVGFFAESVIKYSKNAECIYYRPSITLNIEATGYTSEYYGFINDVIPGNIINYLCSDKDLDVESEKWKIALVTDHDKDTKKIIISTRHLFYIVASLVYDKYYKVLRTPGDCNESMFNCDEIISLTRNAIINHMICSEKNISINSNMVIETEFNQQFDNIIYHMVSFVFIYHRRSSSRRFQLIANKENRSVIYVSGKNPNEVFNISQSEWEVLLDSKKNPNSYYDRKNVLINGKNRELIKYSVSLEGQQLRDIHEKIFKVLVDSYKQHALSFAYRKGYSIKKCVSMHVNNKDFIKFDISKFFESINLDILLERFMDEYQIDKSYTDETRQCIECFFVYGKLPLGLVLSPLLSDIYLKDMDRFMHNYSSQNNYVYTRYADDILISCNSLISNSNESELHKTISDLLSKKKLRINKKKYKHISLDADGKFIKYIGLNIVKGPEGNNISIGRKYIHSVAKEYLVYLEAVNLYKEFPEHIIVDTLNYQRQRLIGRIGFIEFIEGDSGLNKIVIRLKDKANISLIHLKNIS